MAPVASLSEIGEELVDLHGQHAHQSLLRPAAQRDALDTFAGSDLEPVAEAKRELASIDARLDDLGGDPRELARTVDLLGFQLDEIGAAGIESAEEESQLVSEENMLAEVGLLREAASGPASCSQARTPPSRSKVSGRATWSGWPSPGFLPTSVSRPSSSPCATPRQSSKTSLQDCVTKRRV